jgi:hypothetical protein
MIAWSDACYHRPFIPLKTALLLSDRVQETSGKSLFDHAHRPGRLPIANNLKDLAKEKVTKKLLRPGEYIEQIGLEALEQHFEITDSENTRTTSI